MESRALQLHRVLNQARARNLTKGIVLDSKNDMTTALALYRSAGFKEIPDYNGNRRAEVFMALDKAPGLGGLLG